ncbi:hypothetical protein [Tardiphaga sp.]|uniref:hypothetical protein n=1 Tax=Tardiphaga sp. TaxID=1926292 RepID=UPI0026034664|nr:hypothetical protein [Tardiphaga sp.]
MTMLFASTSIVAMMARWLKVLLEPATGLSNPGNDNANPATDKAHLSQHVSSHWRLWPDAL